MARTVDDPFLEFDEETLWWEEPRERSPPLSPVAPAPRRARRPPPRTLARDLAQLRARLARDGFPLPTALLLAFVALVALA
ncbi:MAG: hypothetical protein ACRDPP_05600, partial [Gaiellaceae bacterium]